MPPTRPSIRLALPAEPALARTEVLDRSTRSLLADALSRCAARKLESEPLLRAALTLFAPLSPGLRATAADVADELVRKGAVSRALFGACLQSLRSTEPKTADDLWRRACAWETEGVGMVRAGLLGGVGLASWSQHPESAAGGAAFALRLARAALGDRSSSAALPALASRLSEASRTEITRELVSVLPMSWLPDKHTAEALWAFARQERHTGRWVELADVAVRGGLEEPLRVASARAKEYTGASSETWSLVAAWLARANGQLRTRPAVVRGETLRKLSATPSPASDLSVGDALVSAANPGMLAWLRDQSSSPSPVANRILPWVLRARIGGEDAAAAAAFAQASLSRAKTDAQRGPLAVLLAVSGEDELARDVADELLRSRSLAPRIWSAVVRLFPDQAFEASIPLWDSVVTDS